MLEAVNLIEQGQAPRLIQSEDGASYDPMLNKKELTELKLDELSGKQLHNFIRGCDTVPGAWIRIDGQTVKLFGSKRWRRPVPTKVEEINIDSMKL